jgi:hypothetical protein
MRISQLGERQAVPSVSDIRECVQIMAATLTDLCVRIGHPEKDLLSQLDLGTTYDRNPAITRADL